MIHFPHWVPVYLARPLGWALVHAVWEVALVAVAYRAFEALAHSRAPAIRHRGAWTAMLLAVLLPAITFAVLAWQPGAAAERARLVTALRDQAASPTGSGPDHRHPATISTATGAPVSGVDRVAALLDPAMPGVAALWIGSLCLGALSLAVARHRATALARTSCRDPAPRERELLARMSARLGVRRPVQLRLTNQVETPGLVGWRHPVILLPGSAEPMPDPTLRAVLAHELAHVQRHDIVANLVQAALLRVLVFHPAACWLAGRIRRERELCCDLAASHHCDGGRLAYARGLASLEEQRVRAPVLAAAEGDLFLRIRRLVDPSAFAPRKPWRALAGLVAVLALAGLTSTLVARSRPATAIDGLDPIALIGGRHTPGSTAFATEWGGLRYLFADAASRDRFLSDPRAYGVVNAMICPLTGRRVRSDIYRVIDGRIVQFCCTEAADSDTRPELIRSRVQALVAN